MKTAYQLLDSSARALPTAHAITVDPNTALMWSAGNVGNGRMTHAEATKACADLRLGGFTDWRLPTIQELLTLVDYSRHNPAIDTDAFQCEAAAYWTSSPAAWAPADDAWIVSFYDGHSFCANRHCTAFVRAVRSVGAGQ